MKQAKKHNEYISFTPHFLRPVKTMIDQISQSITATLDYIPFLSQTSDGCMDKHGCMDTLDAHLD